MIRRIIEIGIAVHNIKKMGGVLVDLLGAKEGSLIEVREFDMLMQMYRIGNIEFELMEPLHQDSLIAKFLENKGDGFHHIAFEVDNITESVDWMKKHNVRVINEIPVLIDSLKAIFLHPHSFKGVLIEIIEGNPAWVDNLVLPTDLQNQKGNQQFGAEGILEVGIIVEDLEDAARFYSEIFSSEILTMDIEPAAVRKKIIRVGNVGLKLMEIGTEERSRWKVSGEKPVGIHFITLKVNDLINASTWIQGKGRDLSNDVPRTLNEPKSVFIDPKGVRGILIQLKEEIPSWYKNEFRRPSSITNLDSEDL